MLDWLHKFYVKNVCNFIFTIDYFKSQLIMCKEKLGLYRQFCSKNKLSKKEIFKHFLLLKQQNLES